MGRPEKGRKSISGRDGGVVVALINGTSNQVKGKTDRHSEAQHLVTLGLL